MKFKRFVMFPGLSEDRCYWP
ncbi:hypothetical protein SASC598J21_006830, partial [Snodgrassella alvi SCGC AB-598-J21]